MSAAALPPPLPPRAQAPPARRSTFVNVLAWMTIGLCLLGLPFIALEIALLAGLRDGRIHDWLRPVAMHVDVVAFVSQLSRWLPWLIVLSLVQCVPGLVAAVGLLKRREWARRTFVGLLVFTAVWQCAMIPWQWSASAAIQRFALRLSGMPAAGAAQLPAQFDLSLLSSQITSALTGLVFVGGYVWLAWKLCTPGVRAEFGARRAASIAPPA